MNFVVVMSNPYNNSGWIVECTKDDVSLWKTEHLTRKEAEEIYNKAIESLNNNVGAVQFYKEVSVLATVEVDIDEPKKKKELSITDLFLEFVVGIINKIRK